MADRFRDRAEAGRILAQKLEELTGDSDVIVLALPRGGVPVGFEIAAALGVPLDVFVVRKLGVPGQEELAMGAISTGGVRIINEDVVRGLGITDQDIAQVAAQETIELERRERSYRGDRMPLDLSGKTAVVVDDGLATGSTMRAAIAAVKGLGPKRVVVAVPVGARSTCAELAREADEMVCALQPEPMAAISLWYEDFAQTSDDEVRRLLEQAGPSDG